VANLSSSTPSIELLVRNQFLYNQKEGFDKYTPGWLVGVRTIKGYATTFYVLLNNGVLFTGLPIHALCSKPSKPMDLQELEMWDSISYDHSVLQFDFLKSMSCQVLLKDKKVYDGKYVFSIDFSSQSGLSNISETPNEWKVFHFIKLENGNFALYPQNRILFKDASFINPTDPSTIKYQVNTQEWFSENGNKWTVSNDYDYLYGVEKK